MATMNPKPQKGTRHLKAPPTASAPLSFYSTGKYPDSASLHKFLKVQKHGAEPSLAAKLSERNPASPDAEVNVKPTLHDKFNNKLYLPGRYLNPYGCQRSRFKDTHNRLEKAKQADTIHTDHLGRAKIAYSGKRSVN